MGFDVCNIVRLAGGIHHQEKTLLVPARNDEVVQHAALFVGEQGIGLAVQAQPAHVRRHQRFQQRGAAFTREHQLPHVRDIEQAGLRTRVQVFMNNSTAVLQWHVVAGKWNHARPEFAVERIQRCV